MDDEPNPTESEYPPEGEGEDGDENQRRRIERLLRDVIRRGLEKGINAGVGTIKQTDRLRDIVSDVKLPKEIVGYAFSQVDETKNALVRVVAREVREFLDATDLSQELQKALTSLSFEIKTEIRFIPNDAGGVKPDVKAKLMPRRKKKSKGESTDDDGETDD
ncbi:MAG: hypothetical protein AAGF12_12390 [Myxococcota bacterium]